MTRSRTSIVTDANGQVRGAEHEGHLQHHVRAGNARHDGERGDDEVEAAVDYPCHVVAELIVLLSM